VDLHEPLELPLRLLMIPGPWEDSSTDAVCQCSSVDASNFTHSRVGGAVGLVSAKQSERGGAASGVKWPHGVPVGPSSRLHLRSAAAQRAYRHTPAKSCPLHLVTRTDRTLTDQHIAATSAQCCFIRCKMQLQSLRDKDSIHT